MTPQQLAGEALTALMLDRPDVAKSMLAGLTRDELALLEALSREFTVMVVDEYNRNPR